MKKGREREEDVDEKTLAIEIRLCEAPIHSIHLEVKGASRWTQK